MHNIGIVTHYNAIVSANNGGAGTYIGSVRVNNGDVAVYMGVVKGICGGRGKPKEGDTIYG